MTLTSTLALKPDLCTLYLLLVTIKSYEIGIYLKIKRKFFYQFPNNKSLYNAVKIWYNNQKFALSIYGDISIWDTSKITDMSYLFEYYSLDEDMYSYGKYNIRYFNENIGAWNTSKVKNMKGMFYNSLFNNDISRWDTSQVEDMSYMFQYAIYFNQDISKWNIDKVKDTQYMLANTRYFNQDITNWNLKNANSKNMIKGAEGFQYFK